MTKIGFTAFDINEPPADELPSPETTVSNEPADELPSPETTVSNEPTADKPKRTRRKSDKTEENDADDSND